MSSPIYTAFASPANIFSLPLEVTEQILVECAFAGWPEAIASFSQTCRTYNELIYGGTDSHLWREIYLTTFDDPRLQLNILKRPIDPNCTEDSNFDWRNEYQVRIRGEKLFRDSNVDSRLLAASLTALSSTATSLPPHLSEVTEASSSRESASTAWLKRVLDHGFPPALLRRLTLNQSDDVLSIPEQKIMQPDWDRSAPGRAFHKLFFLTGLHSVPISEHTHEEQRYSLRSRTRETEDLSEADQRAMARNVARHRVYNLPYLSGDRCWGPFLSAQSPPPPPDSDYDPFTIDIDPSHRNKGKGKETSVPADSNTVLAEEPKQRHKKRGGGRTTEIDNGHLVQVDLSPIRAILANFDEHDLQLMDEDEDADPDYVPAVNQSGESDIEEHTDDEFEEGAATELSLFSDEDDEDEEDFFAPATGPFPVYPSRPDLLYPDWAFLAAARLVITENLRERYGSDIPMWPWFTTTAAVQGTREILLRMGISLPPKANGADNEDDDEDEGESEDTNFKAKADDSDVKNESRNGIEALRMGTAPGFWTCRGTTEGWTGIITRDLETELAKPWKIDKDVEFVDGWDWAGAEGRWMRAVCWMDYRDLLFHNLQASYPTAGYRHEIEETCRVFPMTLRVVGYSRVPAPLALPPAEASSSLKLTSKGQEKDKANDPTPLESTYDPLVYALPIIHVVGEFRGSDVDESVARRARGTIRMIGDRAIRWNLISSEVSTPERDEWVMEGVQVGEIGSAMGVIGMWTGAQHERADPIGPSWAWKME